jgi:hypothetical protein
MCRDLEGDTDTEQRGFISLLLFFNKENRLTSGIIISEEWILEDWLRQLRVTNQTDE